MSTDNNSSLATVTNEVGSLSIQSTATTSASGSDPASTASSSSATSRRILNINIGILGHVDSGKTSLAKALSSVLSTAALDKLPQSQSRGITLDLGFSAFFVPVPEALKAKYEAVQYTLVDCPGHASLIRTILGGAAIIDLMCLVIDVTKGMQTQTAECLIIGEILTERMIVVLNKVDLLQDKVKDLAKMEKKLRQIFAQTKFGKDILMIPVSANPGSMDDLKIKPTTASSTATPSSEEENKLSAEYKPDVSNLIQALSENLVEPVRARSLNEPFLFAVDHCFQMKGQGCVLTGTVLSGRISLNDMVEIPSLKQEYKVKSMQMFKKPISLAMQGDRLGIGVTQLKASDKIERGLLCTPGSIATYDSVIAIVDKVRFFKGQCANKSKFHISIGHSTAMATVHFFGGPKPKPSTAATATNGGSGSKKKSKDESKEDSSATASSSSATGAAPSTHITTSPPIKEFDFSQDYAWRDELLPVGGEVEPYTQYAVLEFEKPVQCPLQSLLIGSRLDADIHLNSCRIAFQGRVLTGINWSDAAEREKLHVYKLKEKVGTIDRIVDERNLIGKDLFQKGTDMNLFLNMKIELESGERGVIESSFGQGGKFKAYFQDGLPIPSAAAAASSSSSTTAAGPEKEKKSKNKINLKGKIFLRFKKYMFAQEKKQMIQDK